MHRRRLSKVQLYSNLKTVPSLKKVAAQMAIIKKAGEGLVDSKSRLSVVGAAPEEVLDAIDASDFFADVAFRAASQSISEIEGVIADIGAWTKKAKR